MLHRLNAADSTTEMHREYRYGKVYGSLREKNYIDTIQIVDLKYSGIRSG